MTSGSIAVFDLGKTNSKLLVFGPDGEVLHESRTRPVWHEVDGFRCLDDAALFAWMSGELTASAERLDIGGVMVSGHGCTFALTRGETLAHPILDYEQEPPAEIAARIDPQIPPFAETYSPVLPLGFNAGRFLLWLEDQRPGALADADAILMYPQFWTWRFSGVAVSEVSYLGCHTHLWSPATRDFSSLVESHGWRAKMPALARAGSVVGHHDLRLPDGGTRRLAVHNAVHDSNASLYFYKALGHADFACVSTGTWVIVMNPGCDPAVLDERRDMLANVSVDDTSVPTVRFMGGREFDTLTGGEQPPVTEATLAEVIARDVMALPSFAPGGPFPGRDGSIRGEPRTAEERTAVALLYVVLMTDLSLDLIRSTAAVIVDGGLAQIPAYATLLGQLRPTQPVLIGTNLNGSASGAATLAFEATGRRPFTDTCRPIEPSAVPGLVAYRARWRERVGAASDARVAA